MKYIVDTNIWINYLRKRGNTSLTTRILTIDPADIVICTIVRAELLTGSHKGRESAKGLMEIHQLCSLFKSLPFDVAAADVYGRIRAQIEREGYPIGAHDLMIAAIALANDLTVVTHNTSEYARVPNLRLEDWQP